MSSAERQPLVLAVLAQHAHALRASARAVVAGPAETPTRTRPLRTGSRPKSVRSSRVRPAPSSPAMPKISPRCSVNVADPGSSAATSRIASPRVRGDAREEIADGAADHQRDDRRRDVASAVASAAGIAPSRSTMNRSATLFTSSMKCEM